MKSRKDVITHRDYHAGWPWIIKPMPLRTMDDHIADMLDESQEPYIFSYQKITQIEYITNEIRFRNN